MTSIVAQPMPTDGRAWHSGRGGGLLSAPNAHRALDSGMSLSGLATHSQFVLHLRQSAAGDSSKMGLGQSRSGEPKVHGENTAAPPLNKNSPVIVVGAGTWGASTALYLGRRGYTNVVVLDPHPYPSPISAGNDVNKIAETSE